MSLGIQAAEQTVRLAVRAGGEIKRVGRPSIVVVAAEMMVHSPSMRIDCPLGSRTLLRNLPLSGSKALI